MKKDRHSIILNLIEDNIICTQEELLDKLLKSGVMVTQATVSRDIKELRLVKHPDANGVYRYTVAPQKNDDDVEKRYGSIFFHSVINVDRAENIVVLKCSNGTAQAACAALDSLNLEGVVGTIAGDDTIFILCRTKEIAGITEELLKTMVD